MRVVLCEAAHSHQTVELAGFLMAVYKSQLAHADRKIAVRAGLGFIDKDASRAVHRLDSKIHVIDHCCIHIFLIVIPVS